eukprot:1794516-Prymnesium_polylepis.1
MCAAAAGVANVVLRAPCLRGSGERLNVARNAVTCNICETRVEPTQIVTWDKARCQEVDTILKLEKGSSVSATAATGLRDPNLEPANSR